MRIVRTEAFKKDFKKLPIATQNKFVNKINLFIKDINHPSLRVKKMEGYVNRGRQVLICFIVSLLKFIKIFIFCDG